MEQEITGSLNKIMTVMIKYFFTARFLFYVFVTDSVALGEERNDPSAKIVRNVLVHIRSQSPGLKNNNKG